MAKVESSILDYWTETVRVLNSEGALLVSQDADGKPNPMTIGWGTLGTIWGKPIFTVLVRPSRYTYGLMETADDFTVNVAPRELMAAVAFCGRESGRDFDKFEHLNLTATPGKHVKSPIIEECVIHYECRVVHKHDLIPGNIAPEIVQGSYPKGDFHRVYYGEVLAVYADADAKDRITRPRVG